MNSDKQVEVVPPRLSFPPYRVRGGGLPDLRRTFEDGPWKRDPLLAQGTATARLPSRAPGGRLPGQPAPLCGGSAGPCFWGCEASGLLL